MAAIVETGQSIDGGIVPQRYDLTLELTNLSSLRERLNNTDYVVLIVIDGGTANVDLDAVAGLVTEEDNVLMPPRVHQCLSYRTTLRAEIASLSIDVHEEFVSARPTDNLCSCKAADEFGGLVPVSNYPVSI